jgi:hypothetical protein
MKSYLTFDHLIIAQVLLNQIFVLKKLNRIFTMLPEKQHNYSYNIQFP